MKKILFSFFAAACIMVALPGHTVYTGPKTEAVKNSQYRVEINLVGTNGQPSAGSFYFYVVNSATGDFYEFDYYENAFLLPAGTYYFDGIDATGSGWCGVSGTQATITCSTTVTMTVWCE